MLTKVYRGYIIQQTPDNQWFINNFPEWTTAGAINPGPFPSWTTATHQVNKLIEFINRGQNVSDNIIYEDVHENRYDVAEYESSSGIIWIISFILLIYFCR